MAAVTAGPTIRGVLRCTPTSPPLTVGMGRCAFMARLLPLCCRSVAYSKIFEIFSKTINAVLRSAFIVILYIYAVFLPLLEPPPCGLLLPLAIGKERSLYSTPASICGFRNCPLCSFGSVSMYGGAYNEQMIDS